MCGNRYCKLYFNYLKIIIICIVKGMPLSSLASVFVKLWHENIDIHEGFAQLWHKCINHYNLGKFS